MAEVTDNPDVNRCDSCWDSRKLPSGSCSTLRVKKMCSVTNLLTGNLALSDMAMCTSCLPLTLAYAFEPCGSIFGSAMSYLVCFVQPVTVYVSMFTLATIAVNRYTVIVNPLQRLLSLQFSAFVILFIWILTCCLALPVIARTVELGQQEFNLCEEFWIL